MAKQCSEIAKRQRHVCRQRGRSDLESGGARGRVKLKNGVAITWGEGDVPSENLELL